MLLGRQKLYPSGPGGADCSWYAATRGRGSIHPATIICIFLQSVGAGEKLWEFLPVPPAQRSGLVGGVAKELVAELILVLGPVQRGRGRTGEGVTRSGIDNTTGASAVAIVHVCA